MSHFTGLVVQAPSRPLVIVSAPLPVPNVFVQPRPLLLEAGRLGFGAAVFRRVGGAVGLAEGVAAGDQRHGLLVIHGHAAERLADVPGRGERIRFAVGAFRIHVDQAHLHGAVAASGAPGRRRNARPRATRSPTPS